MASVVKYLMLLFLLAALISIIRFIITPLEKTITIQEYVLWLILIWAFFGMIHITKMLAEDWDKMMKK